MSGQFQKIFSFPVQGQVYAQPLYVPGVKEPGGLVRNLLVVATMHNIFYVFDADAPVKNPATTPAPLMAVSLGTPVPFNYMPMAVANFMIGSGVLTVPNLIDPDHKHYNIYPEIGVTGTPVVDTMTMRVYVVAKVDAEGGALAFRLWCFDLRTRTAVPPSPVTITASAQGSGAGSVGGVVTFDPKFQHQRPGLLLSQGSIYIGFGSHQDTSPFHGWVLRYDAATLQQTGLWCSTPNGAGGAIWQAGSGLAADESGRLYVMTGNGFGAGDMNPPTNYAQSFVELSPGLGVLGWFTPGDAVQKSAADLDLGISGPVLLPNTSMVVGVGKDGVLFLLDRNTTVGKRQSFQASKPRDFLTFSLFGYHHVHGTPVVWRTSPGQVLIYLWPERDKLRVFRYDDAAAVFAPAAPIATSTIETPAGSLLHRSSMPGGMLSLSARGSTHGTGLVWASHPTSDDAFTAVVPGMLRVLNAEDVTQELWNSEQNSGRDRVGLFAKYTPPTIANGRVYVATFSNQIVVYGLRQWATFLSQSDRPANLASGSTFTFQITMENTGSTTWTPNGYGLGFDSPEDATTWGTNRIPVPRDVGPGEWVTFDLSLTAPTTTHMMSYNFSWRLVRDGVEWFGEATPTQVIWVVP